MNIRIKNEKEFTNIQTRLATTNGFISLIIRDNDTSIDFTKNELIQIDINIGKEIVGYIKFPGNEGLLYADIVNKVIFSRIYESLLGNKYGIVLKINIDNEVTDFLSENRSDYPYDDMIRHILRQTEADFNIITIIDVYNLNIDKYIVGKSIKVNIPKYIDSDNYIMVNTKDFEESNKVEYVNTLTYEKNQINLVLLNNDDDNLDIVTSADTVLTDISVRATVNVLNRTMLIQYINNNSEAGKIPLMSVRMPFNDLREINKILNDCMVFKSKCLEYDTITYSIIFDIDAYRMSKEQINLFIDNIRKARLNKHNLILVRLFINRPIEEYKVEDIMADKIYRIDDVEKYVLLKEKNDSAETFNCKNDKFLIPVEPGRLHIIQTDDSINEKNIISIINDICISLTPNLIYMVDNFDITKDIKPLSMIKHNSICVIKLDSLKNMILYDMSRLAKELHITILVLVKNDIDLNHTMIESVDNVIKYEGGLKEIIKSRI